MAAMEVEESQSQRDYVPMSQGPTPARMLSRELSKFHLNSFNEPISVLKSRLNITNFSQPPQPRDVVDCGEVQMSQDYLG